MVGASPKGDPLPDLRVQDQFGGAVVRVVGRVVDEHINSAAHTNRHALGRPVDRDGDVVATRALEGEPRRTPEYPGRRRYALTGVERHQLGRVAHDDERPDRVLTS